MIYKVLLILLIIALRYIVYSKQGRARDLFENRSCTVVWAVIVIMVSFRNPEVGVDSMSYYMDYMKLPQSTFSDLADSQADYVVYYLCSKLFSLMGMPAWIWFGFVEALYVCSLAMFVNKFSKDRLFSILVFVTIGLFSFSFSGLKQVMAMSFMMFAFLLFIEKKYLFTVLLAYIAYMCHPSSFVFLITFPVYWIRNKRIVVPIMVVGAVLIYIYSTLFMTHVIMSLESEHFESYLEVDTSYSYVTLLFYAVVFAFSMVYYRSYSRQHQVEARLGLGFSVIIVALQSLSSISPNLFRLAYYFLPFTMCFLPNSLKYEENAHSSFVRPSAIIFLILYFLYTNRDIDFHFIWQ